MPPGGPRKPGTEPTIDSVRVNHLLECGSAAEARIILMPPRRTFDSAKALNLESFRWRRRKSHATDRRCWSSSRGSCWPGLPSLKRDPAWDRFASPQSERKEYSALRRDDGGTGRHLTSLWEPLGLAFAADSTKGDRTRSSFTDGVGNDRSRPVAVIRRRQSNLANRRQTALLAGDRRSTDLNSAVETMRTLLKLNICLAEIWLERALVKGGEWQQERSPRPRRCERLCAKSNTVLTRRG
jgi:hypothetical protein